MPEAPALWVVAHSVCGRSDAGQRWLGVRRRSYVLMVPSMYALRHAGRRSYVKALAAMLPGRAWTGSVVWHGAAADNRTMT